MAGSAREEAERLVASILARAASAGVGAAARGFRDAATSSGTDRSTSRAAGSSPASTAATVVGDAVDGFFGLLNDVAKGQPGGSRTAPRGWATGSPECCVCPVCRAIAATRDPSPETVFKVATGAGDIATGAASVLRGLSTLAGSVLSNPRPARKSPGGGAARHAPSPDQAWSTATRSTRPAPRPAEPTPATPAPATPASAMPGSTTPAQATPGAAGSAGPGSPASETDPWAAATAESAREADAARARARAAERAVARAVADARRTTGRIPAPGEADPAERKPGTGEAETAAPKLGTGEAETAERKPGTGEAETAKRKPGTGGTGTAKRNSATGGADAVPKQGEAQATADPAADRPKAAGGRRKTGGDVWSVVTAEAAADAVDRRRSVDHERGAEVPEDGGAGPGDDARDGDAV
ncbi:hypothetical protein [Actinoplanes sp. L3-i22]|uniref:hypothetical protein n=1 Tax=Actinoplanes sp. L3-i22 TaxID=2836373 RepID=UPI001C76A30A|nr:hypothetical protein [Actinoplanes sp. L3-i22]BCY06531.1 hypothetical protein L3i22_016190 [Actinoplanes sp. L3-i22]